jgi:DNA-binding transcriptional LysR family regulator
MGITFLPKSLIAADIEKKRLELLLPGVLTFEGQLFAVYPSRKYLSAKVRTFIDFIAADPRLK